ncbi:ComEA family DNA-binding protein [Streptomyces sp. NPDC005483]|uniref:ComEA family DNA-binding protein n=1 Tax=Streptomyces sp. NPDC005483 TaxID=3154882 RepID=UPI0033AC9538
MEGGRPDRGSGEGTGQDGGVAEGARLGRGSLEGAWPNSGLAEEVFQGGRAAEEGWPDGGVAEEVFRGGRAAEEGWPDGGVTEARPDRGSVAGVRPDGSPGEGSWRDTASRPGVRQGPDSGGGDWRERAGLALRERMPVWLQTRCGLERRNVVALSVLLVVAAVFALQHFWTGRTQSVQAPEVVRAAAPFGQTGAEGGQTGEGGPRGAAESAVSGGVTNTAGPAGAEIVVDVSGKVREPGIQRLPAGARVADALKAAGGVRPGTNTNTLNRARFLVDGEQVVVGGPAGPAPVPGTGGPVTGGPAGTAAAPVPLNTATVDQLDTLPGVGPVLAQHIVDYRTQHGGFRSVNELREVNGIGDRRFADLRNLVRP